MNGGSQGADPRGQPSAFGALSQWGLASVLFQAPLNLRAGGIHQVAVTKVTRGQHLLAVRRAT